VGPDFLSYICNVNDHLASIMVDLGLHSMAPLEAKPWLLWVWIYMQAPRPDGLSSSAEAPKLYQIEDAIELHLKSDVGAIFCGRITTSNRRELYFYGEKTEGLEAGVDVAIADFAGYTFDVGTENDPGWNHYLNVLYPSADDLERIKNGDLLDVLTAEGDILSIPRKVMHWIYFPSSELRTHFRTSVSEARFTVESEPEVDGDRRFSICLSRIQPIEQDDIDDTVIQLLHLARGLDGDYDGWETPITKQ
jgi:hypothetical protein